MYTGIKKIGVDESVGDVISGWSATICSVRFRVCAITRELKLKISQSTDIDPVCVELVMF